MIDIAGITKNLVEAVLDLLPVRYSTVDGNEKGILWKYTPVPFGHQIKNIGDRMKKAWYCPNFVASPLVWVGSLKKARGKVVEPGSWWYCPWFHDLQTYDVTEGNIRLGARTLQTSDGKNVVVGFDMIYRVKNPLTYQKRIGDGDAPSVLGTITGLSLERAIHKRAVHEFKSDLNNGCEITREVLEEVGRYARQRGLQVLDGGFRERTAEPDLRYHRHLGFGDEGLVEAIDDEE